jgi:pyruvate/2-oxoglutarate dehydrogenase complex dihydrolipoamide dehydrogenase (E3) component
VYAVGDVADGEQFAHAAGHAAERAVRDMFFPGRAPVADLVPWCTFTDPELAHAGLTTDEAEARFGEDVDVWRVDLRHNDRARADEATEGAIVVVTAKERVVGAHVLAPSAGELIHELTLAIQQGLTLNEIASLVHVYPTMATSVGMLAAESAHEKAKRYRWLVRRR